MWSHSDSPYKFSRPGDADPIENEDSAGFADLLGDAWFNLRLLAVAIVAAYVLAPIFQPAAWAAL